MHILTLLESKNIIAEYIKYLQKHNIPMDGGNCGVFSIALSEIFGKGKIGILTNLETEQELLEDEPDIYHMTYIKNNVTYDATGITTSQNLLDIANDQYRNYNPEYFIFNVPEELNAVETIVNRNTDYSLNINDYKKFYDQFKHDKNIY